MISVEYLDELLMKAVNLKEHIDLMYDAGG